MKFKVGDIIKGKKSNGYGCTNENMTKAEVVKISDGMMQIKVLESKDGLLVGDYYTVDNSSKKFELVYNRKPTKQELFDMPIGTKIYTDAEDKDFQEWIKVAKHGFINGEYEEWIDEKDIREDLIFIYEDYGTRITRIEEPTYNTIYAHLTETQEMTVKEIEEVLGHPVKIIKEEK